jgi:succinate dehydrogenase/fumarate reductase flavoprotein subunit
MKPAPINNIIETEILVIGAGLGGSIAAVKAKQQGKKVTLVDKGYIGWGSQTMNAAGSNVNCSFPEDDKDIWMKEFIVRGEYLGHQEWIRTHLNETYSCIEELDTWGEKYGANMFPKDKDNKFMRIQVHGDRFPMSIVMDCCGTMATFRKIILDHRIDIYERIVMTDLLTEGGQAIGAVGFNHRNGETYLFRAKAVILANGGTSMKFHEGRKNNTGEGQYMAYKAGAKLRNLEQGGSRPVGQGSGHTGGLSGVGCCISMAFGQRLLNRDNEEFMWRYDKELGGRNYQSQTAFIKMEVEEGRGPIYVDYSQIPKERRTLVRRLKLAKFKMMEASGLDPWGRIEHTGDFARIPSMHGSSTRGGGVDVDMECATNIKGLYAVGDTAPAPLTGGHTFGGTNLAWAILSGFKSVKHVCDYVDVTELPKMGKRELMARGKECVYEVFKPLARMEGILPDEATYRLQQAIVPFDKIQSHRDTLEKALTDLDHLESEVLLQVKAQDNHDLMKATEFKSMLNVAKLILKSCLFREESRGQAVRRDFPLTDNINWLKWVMVEKKGDKPRVYARPIPTPLLKAPRTTYEPPPKGR